MATNPHSHATVKSTTPDPTIATASDVDDLGVQHHSESLREMTKAEAQKLKGDLKMAEAKEEGIAITDNEPRTVGESWQKTKDAASATGKYVSGAATKAAGAIKEAIAGSTPGDSVDTTSRQETAGSSGVSKLHQAAPNENNPNAGRTAPGSGTSVDTVEAKSEAPPSQRPKLATYEGVPQQPIGNAKHVSTGAVTDANPNPHDGTRAA